MGGIKPTNSHLGIIRLAARMSQDVVADATGKHQTVIGDWERGEYRPTMSDLHILAGLYGVNIGAVEVAVDKDMAAYAKANKVKRRTR